MTDLKIKDKIEIMLDDEILTGIITGISTRETDREFWESYHVELENKGWSILITHIKDKQDD